VATGDCTLSISVEGGVTKTAAIDSATRVLALKYVTENENGSVDTDAEWQVYLVNQLTARVVKDANRQAVIDATPTAKTFTAAE